MNDIQIQKKLERRAKIGRVEKLLAQQEGAVFGDSDLMPLEHFFCDGIYVRKITIPAGIICTGKIHRHQHPAFLLKGKVTVFTEQTGSEIISAPAFMVSEAGTKRAILSHEETEWYTVHRTDKTDLDEIEKEVITPDYDCLDAPERKELP